ncbi:MAG: hypothetical protein PHG14_10760 [Desulfobacter postgatei]|uniref:hypothetical protein n=1 Tax=Desulfobacter postgatei TaxID=2293 RepID=UPI0023F51F48|nr:hypothetical protein [Desulfobacter postgatei]MDD4274192.1 hypothetical protein [Desulfobacter postgatei]
MVDFWNIVGLFVTVASFIYALYQGIRSKQLKRLVHSQTWDLHARANNATGAVQTAFAKYKEKYKDNINPEVLEVFSKSAAFNQDLFLDTIRHIYLSEPFDYDRVQEWVKVGKCTDAHKEHFELIANLESVKPGFFARLKSWVL